MKEEKETHGGFAATRQPAKCIVTVHDNCLVKMKKAFRFVQNILRDPIHVTLIIAYCYNGSILLVRKLLLRLHLSYKLNFIIYIYV